MTPARCHRFPPLVDHIRQTPFAASQSTFRLRALGRAPADLASRPWSGRLRASGSARPANPSR
eukprot:15461385-Alexandrium_andersonii.AAC.1